MEARRSPVPLDKVVLLRERPHHPTGVLGVEINALSFGSIDSL